MDLIVVLGMVLVLGGGLLVAALWPVLLVCGLAYVAWLTWLIRRQERRASFRHGP